MSEKELQTTCASGVVMVQNRSYYEIRIPGMESLYFTSFDSNDDIEDLTEDLDDIKPSEGYGTGFFVSKDGKIVTNNHVVSGENKKEAVSDALNQRISYILSSYIQSYPETNGSISNSQAPAAEQSSSGSTSSGGDNSANTGGQTADSSGSQSESNSVTTSSSN